MIAQDSFLMRAPLSLGDIFREREITLKQITTELMETGNFRDRGDAVRQLYSDGHGVVEVMILVDEAIYACKQDAIAREMGQS